MILGVIGCSRVSTPPAPDMAAGVYVRAGYEYFHWKEGLAVMIWHDATKSSSCESSGSTSEVTHVVRCHAISEANHRFDWQIETRDGLTAEFSIDDNSFDLSDGNVFIVTTANGKTDIRQLQRDLSSVKPEGDSITEYALMDVDIQRFIQSTSSGQVYP